MIGKRKLVFLILVTATIRPAFAEDKLYEGFCNPPAQSRPFVRWWWNGDCVSEAEILRELDLMKAAGIGGVEINPIAMPANSTKTQTQSLEWLSPEWNRMVNTAVIATRQRGMLADLIVGSGWPFGGRFLKSEEMIQGVGVNKKVLTGPSQFNAPVKSLMNPPKTRRKEGDMPEPRLLFLRLVPQSVRDIADCLDLMDKVAPDGTVQFDVPAGEHVLYIGTARQGFTAVVWGAPGADGPVLDHFNKTAVEKYLNRMSESLGPALGGRLGDGLRAMFCDSIELSGANWTSGFLDEFERRRGYDLNPYLPFVLDIDAAKDNVLLADNICRVRYDFFRTLVELFHENFIHTFHQWCHSNGVLSRYQAYGSPWLMNMLDGYMIPDIPEGDTWLFNDNFKALDSIRYSVWNKYASSGAHLTGKRLVSCEAMTNLSGVFQATLEYIKQASDLNFITGVNHSVLHGFNYSPPEAGFPGWVRYGTYFNEQNPWWRYFRKWADYHGRIACVLQSSIPQVEIAILGPTADIWSTAGLERMPFIDTPWYLHQLWQAIHQNGCSADYVSEAVLQQAEFDNGKISYGPAAYDAIIVTEVKTLQPKTAQALAKFARLGGKIIFVGCVPHRSPSFKDARENDRIVQQAFQKNLDWPVLVAAPEEGELLQWTRDTLDAFSISPAVRISSPNPRLFQIHHSYQDRDIYFLTNLNRSQPIAFQGRFATGEKTPWRWDTETGSRAVYPYEKTRNNLSIKLEPLESLLLVFEPDMTGEPKISPSIDWDSFHEINNNWQATFHAVQGQTFERNLGRLPDLSEAQDEQLNAFGGVIIYQTEFDISDPQQYVFLNLGDVHGISEVTLNGQSLGVRWWGRHIYHNQNALKPGKNKLEIKVTTVLSNYCRLLVDNPTAQRWTRGRKPVSIGLLGPVKLHAAIGTDER